MVETIRDKLEQHLNQVLQSVSGEPDASANVIQASRPEFGDYQANGIMAVAKRLGQNPRVIAQQVIEQLPEQPYIQRLEVAGPGFINIFLADTWLENQVTLLAHNPEKLIPQVEQALTIVVDYSSPNLAKEMHVGHLRGTIIGDSLVRILTAQGHHAVRQNHVGDWGTQFGMLIAYLEELEAESESLTAELADLEVFYRHAKERFDADPDFASRARACVVKLQGGDDKTKLMWQRFIEESLHHCESVYAKLQVCIQRSDLKPESFYNNKLKGIVNTLDELNLLTTSAGARCVFLPEFTGKDGNPLPVIVQKSDGGYLYATTDLAAIEYRAKELQADVILYVVDARQGLHFQQVFSVARKAGFVTDDCELQHVSYGTMMGQDGKPFKTRSGGTVKLVELLDESIRRAHDLVVSKNPDLESQTHEEIARVVGIGAVKYADLSKNRTSDYVFNWDSMLAFDGNTAPYLLYAYTRIKSILKKQDDKAYILSNISIENEAERALIVKILQLPEVLNIVSRDYYPSHLSTYLYELASTFMRFYEFCPILKAESQLRNSRLVLASITAETLKRGLGLLGLETLQQM